MELANDLYIMMLELSQLDEKEEILLKYKQHLENLFPNRNLELKEFIKENPKEGIVIQTRENAYGVLFIDGYELFDFEDKIFLQNSAQILAVILENIEYRRTLTKEKKELEDISLKQVDEIRRSKLAALNLIEDLTNENTKRKKIEEKLRKSKERLQLALEATSEAVWDWDLVAQKIYFSSRWYEIIGYPKSELVWGTDAWKNIVHPYDIKPAMLAIIKAIRNGTSFNVEYRIKCADGSWKWILSKGSVTDKNEKGRPTRLSGINADITENKLTEAALDRSEANYKMLVEHQVDMVVKVDNKGRFQFVSPSYCKMFGKEEEELLDKKFMPLVHEEDREVTRQIMETLYHEPYECYLEQRAFTVNGWKWLAWSDKAILDENNNVKSILGVGRDITEKKLAQIKSEKRTNELKVLYELSNKINLFTNIEEIISETLEAYVKVTNSDLAFYLKKINDELHVSGVFENSFNKKLNNYRINVGECICGIAADKNEPQYSTDVNKDERCLTDLGKALNKKSIAAIPIAEGNNVFGVIGIASADELDFSEESHFLETIASQVSIAISKLISTKKIKFSEERYRALALNIPDTIIVTDLNCTIEFINHPILPLSKENFLGENFFEFIHPEEQPIIKNHLEDVKTNNAAITSEYSIILGNSETRFNIRIAPNIIKEVNQGFIFVCTEI